MKIRTTVGVGLLALAATACSPNDWHHLNIGPSNPWAPQQTQGAHVDAGAGPDDGGGSGFTLGVVCTGLTGWRWGNYVSVNSSPNYAGRWASEVYCPPGHYVTGKTIARK